VHDTQSGVHALQTTAITANLRWALDDAGSAQLARIHATGAPNAAGTRARRGQPKLLRRAPTQKEGTLMKALSEQLSELSVRSKRTEDVIAATREKDRAKLETQRAALRTSIATETSAAKDRASAAKNNARAQWSDARSSVEKRFTSIRANADARRAEKGVKRAEHHAEAAELDAVAAVDFALYVLDQAEYAVIDISASRCPTIQHRRPELSFVPAIEQLRGGDS
jgi:hypothetical protein